MSTLVGVHSSARGRPHDPMKNGAALELFWIPLGAGTPVVRTCGRCYEAIVAAVQRRPRSDLYHSALVASTDAGTVTVEVAPVPDDDGFRRRGVVGAGPVGSPLLGRWRLFRYEVRRWPDGSIPDLRFAVGGPRTLTTDPARVDAVLQLLAAVPTPVWGRDELCLGEMWNSNSVVAWATESAGLLDGSTAPPGGGRAPGWDAGVGLARRNRSLAPPTFDPASSRGLPAPARRLLQRVLPAGTPLAGSVEIDAVGEIKLGSTWWPFRSTQVLRAGAGFVWRPVVRRGPLRVTGADAYEGGVGRMDFRLFGLLPVARAAGPDVDRSAAGRLAAETVAWLPEALAPQSGARWSPIDDRRATVELATPAGPVGVEVTVDDDGRLVSTRMQRWSDRTDPPSAQPFGGPLTDEHVTAEGVRIAGAGAIGWGWATPSWADGEFFRFRVTATRRPSPG